MADPNAFQTVMNLTTAFWLSRCAHVIAELGVADALTDGTSSAEALASKVGADPGALARLLRLLAAHGIFDTAEGGFKHNEASRMLCSDHPQSLRPWTRMIGGSLNWSAYGALEYAARTGRPSFEKVTPGGIFEYFASHPEEAGVFDQAMTGKSQGQVHAVVNAYDFYSFTRIADIGGGAGHLLQAVLAKAPSAHGILFDLPHVIARGAGLASDRLELNAGDFFKDALPPADLYLLMEVIHDWADVESTKILQAVRRACPPNGKVLLIENLLPESDGPHWAKSLDITMLALTGGRERTRKQYESLLASGGFRVERVVETGSEGLMTPLGLIEANPV